ncbi:hypothetical protein V6N11_042632 [Hibiscus sabdariffa]|uniref:Uncharacterized protein n=1 Tax=Hibiscus sabdariffa TaxID=183260 RepID=A0ABR2QWX9_9ROSI
MVLITTTVKRKISEVVEIEVDNLVYTVLVEEKGFSDVSVKNPGVAGNLPKKDSKKYASAVSSTESTANSTSRSTSVSKNHKQGEEDDTINAVLMSKDGLAGCSLGIEAGNSLEGLAQDRLSTQKIAMDVDLLWANVVKGLVDKYLGSKNLDLTPQQNQLCLKHLPTTKSI